MAQGDNGQARRSRPGSKADGVGGAVLQLRLAQWLLTSCVVGSQICLFYLQRILILWERGIKLKMTLTNWGNGPLEIS